MQRHIQFSQVLALVMSNPNPAGTNKDTSKMVCNKESSSSILSIRFIPDDSTLSKSMTLVAGSTQGHSKKNSRGKNRISSDHSVGGTESDTSISPTTEFSNMPTYRVPVKSSRGKKYKIISNILRIRILRLLSRFI